MSVEDDLLKIKEIKKSLNTAIRANFYSWLLFFFHFSFTFLLEKQAQINCYSAIKIFSLLLSIFHKQQSKLKTENKSMDLKSKARTKTP